MECGRSSSDCVVRNDTTVWEDESYTGGNGGSSVKPGWKLGTWLQFVPTGLLKSLPVLKTYSRKSSDSKRTNAGVVHPYLSHLSGTFAVHPIDQVGSCASILMDHICTKCSQVTHWSPPEVQKRPTWTWSIICFESVDTVQFLISKNRNTLKCIRFPLPSENRLNIFRGQIYYRMLNREKKPQIWGHITHDSEEDLQASIEAFPLPKSLS